MISPKFVLTLCSTVIIAGCGTVAQVSKEIEEHQELKKDTLKTPVTIAPRSRVSEFRGAFLPVTPVKALEEGEWLRRKSVALDIKNPTPLSAVIAKFAEQGVNIVTDLPLSTYTYAGKVNRTNAESALQLVLGAVGLDYRLDEARQIVFIRPIASRSWYVSIGNRRSTFSSDSDGNGSNSANGGRNNGGNSPGSMNGSGSGSGSPGGFGGGSMGGGNGSGSFGSGFGGGSNSGNPSGSSNSGNETIVYASDDFWQSLARELDSRLNILVPNGPVMTQAHHAGLPPIPPLPNDMMPGAMPAPAPQMAPSMPSMSGQKMYDSRQIGTYSLNPETGAITVQAPHWILAELDTYIKGVQSMYNTDISFSGEVVLITTNRGDSEGFDITAFAQWAGGKYGAVFSNNALGGLTMSLPTDTTTGGVVAGSQQVGGPLAGFRYRGSNALDIFNNYLSEMGKVSVIERPMLTTTSGVPGIFEKKRIDYYNTVTQDAAPGGTGSAVMATKNILVPVELGTVLRINPRIDVATGLIRAQIKLDQVIQSGVKNVSQTVSTGSSVQQVVTQIPLTSVQKLSGEILLRDGDLIIVGGQTEDSLSADESGLPGGKSGPMGGLFGTKQANRGAQTYYFALSVKVNKRK